MLIKLLGRKLPWDATKQESSNVPLTSSFKWSSIAPQLFKVSLCFFTWCYSESKPDLNTINKLTKSGLEGQFGLFGGADLCWVYLHNAELTFCIWNLKQFPYTFKQCIRLIHYLSTLTSCFDSLQLLKHPLFFPMCQAIN